MVNHMKSLLSIVVLSISSVALITAQSGVRTCNVAWDSNGGNGAGGVSLEKCVSDEGGGLCSGCK